MHLTPYEYQRRFEMILQALKAEVITKEMATVEIKELDRQSGATRH